MTATRLVMLLIGVGSGLGAATGAVMSAVLAVTDGTLPDLIPLVAGISALFGGIGGGLSGCAVGMIVRARKDWSSSAILRAAFVGSLVGGTATYLLFFTRQDTQSPAVLIALPAAALTFAFWVLLRNRECLNLRLGENRQVVRQPPSVLGVSLIVCIGVLSVSACGFVAYGLVPAGISGADLAADFSYLPATAQSEIMWRATLFVVIALGALASAVVVSFRPIANSFANRYLVPVFLAFGVPAVHVGWLSAAVAYPLVALNQQESPFQPAQAVLTGLGWLALAAGLVVATRGLVRPSGPRLHAQLPVSE